MNTIANRAFALALTGVASIACAHDAWVEPADGNTFAILYGHQQYEPYAPKKVTSLKALDAARRPVALERIPTDKGLSVRAKSKPAFFQLAFDNGYWVKTGTDFKNVDQAAARASAEWSHPFKYAKTILHWEPWMTKPVGQRIELVPTRITGLKAGAPMTVQLLLDGKPLPGIMIENNSNEQGPKTGADGKATLTLTTGVQRLSADYDLPVSGLKAGKTSLTAALVFMAP